MTFEELQAPPKRRVPLKLIIAFLVIAGVLIAAAVHQKSTESRSASTPPITVPYTHEVRYEVEGSAASASLTLSTPSGTRQEADVSLPLMNQSGTSGFLYDMNGGSFAYIAAQNSGESGSVTCRITVDGQVISTNTSSGAYQIATCQGSV